MPINNRSRFSHADVVLFGLGWSSLIFTVAYQLTGLHAEFSTGFAIEDGPVEWGTAIFLFLAAVVLFRNAGVLWRRATVPALTTAVYALVFIFGAGEEISWGQRIFDWESGEFMKEHNHQEETNLHNMVVGEKQLTKTLFGPILTLILLLYLIVLPVLYPRANWVHRVARALSVPVPHPRHAVLAVFASVVMLLVDLDRKWEVYELVFSLLACSIFLRPQNQDEVT